MHPDPPYSPVSCDFHDVLEATATLRRRAAIAFLAPAGDRMQVSDRIVDFVTRGDGEYLLLASGEAIRLDRVVSVDGVRLADFSD
jgi:Rho-binding antiterminator